MRGRIPRRAIVVLTGALVMASCGSDPDPPIGAELAASTVGIVATGCRLTAELGSGVVVGSSNQVVTTAHTIKGASEVAVVGAAGTEQLATGVAVDKDSDLAVLDAPTLRAEPLTVGKVTTGPASLLVWSRNGDTELKRVEVVKSLRITIEDVYVEEIVERTGLEIAGDIQIGDSGGAIVTGGDVIGIVYASSRERDAVGFATDSAEVRAVLADRSSTPVPNGRCV
jgi:S1-C subfamily serine protease